MKKFYLPLLFLFTFQTAFSQAVWQQLNYTYNIANETHARIAVTKDDSKIVAFYDGGGSYYGHWSTDEGSTWDTLINDRLKGVLFDNQNGIFAIISTTTLLYPGEVWHTSDNGSTWNVIDTVTTPGKSSEVESDNTYEDNRGLLYLPKYTPTGAWTGIYGFKYSEDRGDTWEFVETNQKAFSVLKASDGRLYYTTFNSGIFMSDDNGANWTNFNNIGPITCKFLREHPSTGEIYMLVGGSSISKTSDYGATWTTVINLLLTPGTGGVNRFEITSDGMFYVFSANGVYESNNGTNWNLIWNNSVDGPTSQGTHNNFKYAISDNYVYVLSGFEIHRYEREKNMGVSNNSIASKNSVSIFPNPFTETATLRLNDNTNLENGNLRIYDLGGKLIQSIENLRGNNVEIRREAMNPGIYFYQLSENGQILGTGKIMCN